MTEDVDEPPSMAACLVAYRPRSDEYRNQLVEPILRWLETSRRKDKFEIAAIQLRHHVQKLENDILAHFAGYVGGPEYVHKAEAWRLACRQREFVRECCARMMEDFDGSPTASSEAIREIDIGESVKVIPDYSRRAI